MTEFSSAGWDGWQVSRRPLIREGLPILVDDDLRFEDGDALVRPCVAVNRWLRELAVSGAPARRTWRVYAEVLRSWMEFLASREVALFAAREELRSALSAYAGHRLGRVESRWEPTTWNLHVNVLGAFYRWAAAEGYAAAVPFTYATAHRYADGVMREYQRNWAKLRTPKPHTTVRYLDDGFAELFVRALGGLSPQGRADDRFRGRHLGRNAAMGELVLSSGLRRREFTYLLVYEVPALPARRTGAPVLLPVGHGVTKGGKQRITWIEFDVLARVHAYIGLERQAAATDSSWLPPDGPALLVEQPDALGARINGQRRTWRSLGPDDRLRLVAPDGGSCLLALRSNGAPFVDWATVFRRTSLRIQQRFEPRFPMVHPHWLRHSFAMRTLELLVSGYYRQAAALIADDVTDAGLALYLTKADPLMVLRDLLGHSSATTTELYLNRPGGSQALFHAEVQELEERHHLELTIAAFRDFQSGVQPAGPGARSLIETFTHIDAELADAERTAPTILDTERRIENLLRAQAGTLHIGAANFCWFRDPSKALCLRLAGTTNTTRPLIGLCDSARCPQATHHPCHRPVWADQATTLEEFIANPCTPKGEQARLRLEHERTTRVLATIDAAANSPTQPAQTPCP